MPTFKLSVSQFLAATYGSYYDPEKRSPPHVLADNFMSVSSLSGLRDALTAAKTWQTTRPSASQAMSDLLTTLTPAGAGYELHQSSAVYRDLTDSAGNVIAHITIVWPFVGGQPVVLEQQTSGAFDFGMVASLLLVIQKA